MNRPFEMTEEVSTKEIPDQLARLEKALLELAENVVSLEQRLSPALSMDMVREVTAEKPMRQLVPLAEVVRQRIGNVEDINQRVLHLLQGLQL